MKIPQEIKIRTIICFSKPTSGHIYKLNKTIILKRYLYSHVHCSIIHNRDIETMCLSTDEWIKKMWYICTMEYYSAFKKGNPAICDTMDENAGHYTKCNRLDRERYTAWYYLNVES